MKRELQSYSYGVQGNSILPEVEFIIDKERGQVTIKKEGRSLKIPLAILQEFVLEYTLQQKPTSVKLQSTCVWEPLNSCNFAPLSNFQPVFAPATFEPRSAEQIVTCAMGANGPAGPCSSNDISIKFNAAPSDPVIIPGEVK